MPSFVRVSILCMLWMSGRVCNRLCEFESEWQVFFVQVQLVFWWAKFYCKHAVIMLTIFGVAVNTLYEFWAFYRHCYVRRQPRPWHYIAPHPLQTAVAIHSRCYLSFPYFWFTLFYVMSPWGQGDIQVGEKELYLFACFLTWIQYTPHVQTCWSASYSSESTSVIFGSYHIFSDLSPPDFDI